MEEKFWKAARGGRVEEVKEILRSNPTLNVNVNGDHSGWRALHQACYYGHDSIVSILLAHPDIDVNQTNADGFTPFYMGCSSLHEKNSL